MLTDNESSEFLYAYEQFAIEFFWLIIVITVNIRENKLMKHSLLPLTFAILISLLCAGCASNSMDLADDAATTVILEQVKPAEPTVLAFSKETLNDLLIADIALLRQQYLIALPLYCKQALDTRDPGVTEMAFGIARHIENADKTLQMASLWLDIKPQSGEAHRAMLQAYALTGNAIDALPHADWIYQNEGDSSVLLAVTAIAEGRKEAQIDALLAAYKAIRLQSSEDYIGRLAIAMLLRESGRLKQAEVAALNFTRRHPGDPRGSLLLAQIYNQQDRTGDAINLLKIALEDFPASYKLRLQYARLLTISDRENALEQFEMLRLANPRRSEVNFLLALLYLDREMPAPAQQLLLPLTRDPSFRDDASYHLGSIAESNGDWTSAVGYYRQVRSGTNFLTAAARTILLLLEGENLEPARQYLRETRASAPQQIGSLFELEANLLISKNLPEQALLLLSEGIQQRPDDQNLLYARAMIAEKQGNFARAELDLRVIIAQDSNNAAAINALGYTMVLHTQRLDEAYDLIQKAYTLQPESPAIIDSMGWVLYKRGENEKALGYLERAMEMMPDPEIAAHLGEIHWVMGNREMALKAWQRGLQRVPEHENIVTTMQRLGASHSEVDQEQ